MPDVYRIAKISSVYPAYLEAFYTDHPGLDQSPYEVQRTALMHDAFGWFDAWEHALTARGHAAVDLLHHVPPLQKRWAIEKGWTGPDVEDTSGVLIAQLQEFEPEIVWYDLHEPSVLERIRSEVSSVRCILGWVGSAMPAEGYWDQLDLTLSCAPESVEQLQQDGYPAAHLDHAFDPRIIERLPECLPLPRLAFVGSIARKKNFHIQRDRLLGTLAGKVPMDLYSPSVSGMPATGLKSRIRGLAASVVDAWESVVGDGLTPGWLDSRIERPIHRQLRSAMQPGRFGLAMYELLARHVVSLNIHADSSPRFAGNMRLFEVTGVGGCLLTDHRPNLPDFFVPDAEIVSYNSPEDCLEKARWLLDHPREAKGIAERGHARCLAKHTFFHRAEILEAHIGNVLAKPRRKRLKGNG